MFQSRRRQVALLPPGHVLMPPLLQNQQARAIELQLEIDRLQAKLGYLLASYFCKRFKFFDWVRHREGVDAEAIVKRHIHLLHKYNEAKDAAQVGFSNCLF